MEYVRAFAPLSGIVSVFSLVLLGARFAEVEPLFSEIDLEGDDKKCQDIMEWSTENETVKSYLKKLHAIGRKPWRIEYIYLRKQIKEDRWNGSINSVVN